MGGALRRFAAAADKQKQRGGGVQQTEHKGIHPGARFCHDLAPVADQAEDQPRRHVIPHIEKRQRFAGREDRQRFAQQEHDSDQDDAGQIQQKPRADDVVEAVARYAHGDGGSCRREHGARHHVEHIDPQAAGRDDIGAREQNAEKYTAGQRRNDRQHGKPGQNGGKKAQKQAFAPLGKLMIKVARAAAVQKAEQIQHHQRRNDCRQQHQKRYTGNAVERLHTRG